MGSEKDQTYDLLVIGGGTAGLVCAAGAASLGARTALVERDRLGGECLWTGCVPSKALIGSARIADGFRRAADYGLTGAGTPGSSAVLESVREARARVQPHDDPERFRGLGVDVIEGQEAKFVSSRELTTGDRLLAGRRIVIATGSRPAAPPLDGLQEAGFYTHETAFDVDAIPGSVIVLGGGPIGVEFAQAYRRLGSEVTLVEIAPTLLPNEDPELAQRLAERLEEEGVKLLVGTVPQSVERVGEERTLHLESGATVRAEQILVSTGRRPNVEPLELDAVGVAHGPGGVRVDGRLRTSRKHIFAAGDVSGGLQFTHVADYEARTVVRNALFPGSVRADYSVVPWTVFTDPPLARVGLRETDARDRHGDGVRVYRYDIADLDRAITDREAFGLVKLVTDRRGRLLGGHILAPSAGTMIVEVALAMRHGIRIGALAQLIHPYPTMSEGVRRTADAYYRSKLTERSARWLKRYFRVARSLGR